MTDSLRVGGSERQFAAMSAAFRRGSCELYLGCLQRVGQFLQGLGDIEEFPTGGSFFTLRSLRSFFALVRFLRRNRIAVAQSFDFYSNIFLIPAARLAGVPLVMASQRQLGDLLTPAKRRAQNLVFRLADGVVCNSLAAAEQLAKHKLPRSKLTVIANGLPDEAFQSVDPLFAPQPGVTRIGMVARMNERSKNHDIFLRAAANVARRFPLAQFVLAGGGPFQKQWEQLALQLGIAPNTHFLGERHDIPAVLASLDIVVSASRSESLSNSILEAMAAGRPVIASNVGGNPELVRHGETGLLVAPDDYHALAGALETLLNSPELITEWGQNARRIARETFHIDNARDQFEQLYLNLLARKRCDRPAL